MCRGRQLLRSFISPLGDSSRLTAAARLGEYLPTSSKKKKEQKKRKKKGRNEIVDIAPSRVASRVHEIREGAKKRARFALRLQDGFAGRAGWFSSETHTQYAHTYHNRRRDTAIFYDPYEITRGISSLTCSSDFFLPLPPLFYLLEHRSDQSSPSSPLARQLLLLFPATFKSSSRVKSGPVSWISVLRSRYATLHNKCICTDF